MIYGYIRVSSDKQTVENLRFEINKFCERNKLAIDGWIEETISGTKAYNKRELGKLLKRVQKEDLIICAELSRLGRNLFMIMEILNICMSKECRGKTTIDLVMTYKAKFSPLLSDCLPRLNATSSVSELRKLWLARRLRVSFLVDPKDGKVLQRNINCTAKRP